MKSLTAAEELRRNGHAAYEPDALYNMMMLAYGDHDKADLARVERLRVIEDAAREVESRLR